MTQDAVAKQLGLTSLKVNRLLAEARASGLVQITINARLASCLQLEAELHRECGLHEVVVLPTPQDLGQISGLLGRAAADYLSRHLDEVSVRGIGVGWGATVRETIRFVRPGQWPQLRVNSIMGGLTRGLEINTFETVSALAARLGAQCSYLAAPLYAGSAESRRILVSQDVFKESLDTMATNDVALLSVGDLSHQSLLIRYGLPRDVSAESLQQAGAVGDILGQFLDARCSLVDHPINQRVISPERQALTRVPRVIIAWGAQGGHFGAVLRRKLASVLITDEAAAVEVLRLLRSAV